MLDAELTVAGLLSGSADDLGAVVSGARSLGSVPATARILPPVDDQESCALRPALVPRDAVELPLELQLSILRGGAVAFEGATSTARIRRPLESLVEHLGRALRFPNGAVLLTGTGVVPDAPFTLAAGDVVRIDAGPLGMLENPVIEVGAGAS